MACIGYDKIIQALYFQYPRKMDDQHNTAGETDSLQPENCERLNNEGSSANYRQYVAAFIAHLGAALMAEVWSYSATALPSMREGQHKLGLTTEQEAWVASSTFLGGAIGSFLTGSITDKYGVKATLMIVTVLVLFGWLLITFAMNFAMLLVGRFITGAFVAAVGVSTTLIAEISNPKRRGRLNFLFDMTFCIGVLLIYLFGAFFNWRYQAAICASQCVLFLALLTQIYESPRFLLESDKDVDTQKARDALAHYRDNAAMADAELKIIKQQIVDDKQAAAQNCSGQNATVLSLFVDPTVLKPIYISMTLQFFLQLCGVVPIVCYAVDVFREAGSTHENFSTCIFGLVNLLATCVGLLCVDRLGRRILFMISEFVLTLTLFGLGLFLYYKDTAKSEALQNEYYSWVPLVFLVIYIIGYSFGVGPIPWVVMGEVVNPKAKGFSNGVIIFVARIFGFLVMFYFNDMMITLGQHGVYWLFSGVCFAGFFFALFLLPETKGKDLHAIQEDIQQNWIHMSSS